MHPGILLHRQPSMEERAMPTATTTTALPVASACCAHRGCARAAIPPATPTPVLPVASACCASLGAAGLSDDQAEATARLFKALADPHRVKIVNLLATTPDPVGGRGL